MNASDILEYRLTECGEVELVFKEGSLLRIVPIRKPEYIAGFDRAALYQNRDLEALVSGEHRREEPGFWSRSRGKITQELFLDYFEAAADVGNQCFRDYENGKISEVDWQGRYEEFYIITCVQRPPLSLLVSLHDGNLRVFDKPPRHIEERI